MLDLLESGILSSEQAILIYEIFHDKILRDDTMTALVNDAYVLGETLPAVALIYGMFFILLITVCKVLYRIGKGFASVLKIFLSILLYVTAYTLEKAD